MIGNLKDEIIKNSLLFTTLIEALPYHGYGTEEFKDDEQSLIDHIKDILDTITLSPYELTMKEKTKDEIRLKDELNKNFLKILRKEFPNLFSRTISAKLRNEVLERDNYYCQYCGIDLRENLDNVFPPTVDHVNPVRSGGKNNPKNLVACCWRCNSGKKDYNEFIYKDRRPD